MRREGSHMFGLRIVSKTGRTWADSMYFVWQRRHRRHEKDESRLLAIKLPDGTFIAKHGADEVEKEVEVGG